jgi:hypothetical protein
MDNEIERKGKAFRREQFFKNIAKQVWLIGAIYVEALISHTLMT